MTTGHDLAIALRIAYLALNRLSDAAFAPTAAFDKKVSLLYLHSGAIGLDARSPECQNPARDARKGRQQERGVPRPRGPGHEWRTWRYALHDFAPRLFREKK